MTFNRYFFASESLIGGKDATNCLFLYFLSIILTLSIGRNISLSKIVFSIYENKSLSQNAPSDSAFLLIVYDKCIQFPLQNDTKSQDLHLLSSLLCIVNRLVLTWQFRMSSKLSLLILP